MYKLGSMPINKKKKKGKKRTIVKRIALCKIKWMTNSVDMGCNLLCYLRVYKYILEMS